MTIEILTNECTLNAVVKKQNLNHKRNRKETRIIIQKKHKLQWNNFFYFIV